MEKIFDEVISYLKTTDDDSYGMFYEIGVTELLIPETSKAIKKYILKRHSFVVNSNKEIRLVGLPIIKMTKYIYDYDIIEKYIEYFNDEKECLNKIRELLNYKPKKDEDKIPILACCGFFTHAVASSHLENSKRLTQYSNIAITSYDNGIETIIPNDITTPINTELIKRMTLKINKHISKK